MLELLNRCPKDMAVRISLRNYLSTLEMFNLRLITHFMRTGLVRQGCVLTIWHPMTTSYISIPASATAAEAQVNAAPNTISQ